MQKENDKSIPLKIGKFITIGKWFVIVGKIATQSKVSSLGDKE